MKRVIGTLGIIFAVIAGLYIGLYVCFIGGGIDILNEIEHLQKGSEFSAGMVMWGVIKMLISTAVGWVSFYFLFIPSYLLLTIRK